LCHIVTEKLCESANFEANALKDFNAIVQFQPAAQDRKNRNQVLYL